MGSILYLFFFGPSMYDGEMVFIHTTGPSCVAPVGIFGVVPPGVQGVVPWGVFGAVPGGLYSVAPNGPQTVDNP